MASEPRGPTTLGHARSTVCIRRHKLTVTLRLIVLEKRAADDASPVMVRIKSPTGWMLRAASPDPSPAKSRHGSTLRN
jgi:hypothetical protein